MRLFEFVPVHDALIDGDSLIDQVFGSEFCVVDEIGYLLTTAHNQNLLWKANHLIEQDKHLAPDTIANGLAALRAMAEVVTQRDYDLAVRRETHNADAGHTADMHDNWL